MSERIMQKQVTLFTDKLLSPYLCDYRKSFSKQQALVSLIKRREGNLDRKRYGDTVLMDLSKAFNTLNHNLLLSSLHVCVFFHSYLSIRYQRTKIKKFRQWSKIACGVPEGSVLGPLLFNIYRNDMSYMTELTVARNFADDIVFTHVILVCKTW